MREWERGSLKSRGSYFFVYKFSGNVHYPMWHGKGKGEIHVAKQVKRKLIYLWIRSKKKSRVKVNEHVEHGNQVVKVPGKVNGQIHGKDEVKGKVHGKGEQRANPKVKEDAKCDDAGRRRGKMKMRIFGTLSL